MDRLSVLEPWLLLRKWVSSLRQLNTLTGPSISSSSMAMSKRMVFGFEFSIKHLYSIHQNTDFHHSKCFGFTNRTLCYQYLVSNQVLRLFFQRPVQKVLFSSIRCENKIFSPMMSDTWRED